MFMILGAYAVCALKSILAVAPFATALLALIKIAKAMWPALVAIWANPQATLLAL